MAVTHLPMPRIKRLWRAVLIGIGVLMMIWALHLALQFLPYSPEHLRTIEADRLQRTYFVWKKLSGGDWAERSNYVVRSRSVAIDAPTEMAISPDGSRFLFKMTSARLRPGTLLIVNENGVVYFEGNGKLDRVLPEK